MERSRLPEGRAIGHSAAMLIAQISDMHINAPDAPSMSGIDAIGNLERCVAAVNALDPAPELILATGDLTKDGTADEYATLRALLAPLKAPLYAIPGNHDIREAMRAAFADAPYLPRDGTYLHYVIEDHALRLVALDTVVAEAPHGQLDDGRLDWLAARLKEAPDRPTAILMHHPPFRTGYAAMDAMRCFDGDALGALVAKHPQIVGILCGHLHRASHTPFFGTTAASAPSTIAQLKLDLSGAKALGERAIWSDEPPAYMLHLWQPGEGLVSHVMQV
jgi:3',5'-cyclic AMP phosphodiesterase CpdA